MRLVYFIADDCGNLQRTRRELVEALWHGDCLSSELGFCVGDDLRLVTVLCDDEMHPFVSYFVRLDLDQGSITDDSRLDAFEAMTARHRRKYDHPAAQRQFIGWPSNWQTQLAVALDVPAAELRKLGVGGPLLLSELWGISLDKVLAYFEDAAPE